MFFQFKKRLNPVTKKNSVPYIGRHVLPNGNVPIWVLSRDLQIDEKGSVIDLSTSPLVWIGHLISATGVAPEETSLRISTPLSTCSLRPLVETLRTVLKHNFCAGMLSLGASAMAVHYSTILRKRNHCHVPLLTGPSGTGKTTALKSALSLFGAHESRFFSRGSVESYGSHCCESGLPLGCDDPLSEKQTGQLMVDLYNGAKITSVSKGVRKPRTMVLVSANFSMQAQVK